MRAIFILYWVSTVLFSQYWNLIGPDSSGVNDYLNLYSPTYMGILAKDDGVDFTADNLQPAIDGETYEFGKMSSPMIEAAKEGNDWDFPEIYLYPICGHIETGKPEGSCPICGAVALKYIQIEFLKAG